MLQTTWRENRVVDGVVVQNLSTSPSFFASTTILIIGGGSNCGRFAVQFARLSDFTRIVVVGANGQLGRALQERLPGAVALYRAGLDVSDAAAVRAQADGEVDAEWRAFVAARRTAELESIIDSEGLRHAETQAFIEAAFRDGAIRSLSIDGDSVRAIIDLPATTETREFIETLQGQYPQTELLARRSRDRPATTRHELRTAFEERLTERQQEVLRTAYLSGFFESPRANTGQEITASLGISQPTFIQHLRASQRKIFEMVFDES